jgi:Domain of unknown function (DUF4388)
LGVFNLLDLIQLLAQNNSRGYLGIHHPSQGEGRFYLEEGKLTHASFAGTHDLAALRAVLQDERGSFEFVPNQVPTRCFRPCANWGTPRATRKSKRRDRMK